MSFTQAKTIVENQEQLNEVINLQYTVNGPIGIYKRNDGTYYALLVRGIPENMREEAFNSIRADMFIRRESIIELLTNEYVGTNKTIAYYDDKELVKSRLFGLVTSPSEEACDGYFYNFRVKYFDKIPYIYAEFKKTNRELIISNDYASENEIAPAIFHTNNVVARIDSFYRDTKLSTS